MNEIKRINIKDIDSFEKHPFLVNVDASLYELADSIKEIGLLNPIVVRKKQNGRYELISGHRRKLAMELIGMTEVDACIKQLNDDEAIVFMVDSNMYREKILPSEKAFAYKMKLDAMKHQGRKITSAQVVSKLTTKELIGNQFGDSREQVRRYIRLTYLIPELLEIVDNTVKYDKRTYLTMGLTTAVELSYLNIDEQNLLYNSIIYEDLTPSYAQALKIRELSKKKLLDFNSLEKILDQKKGNQNDRIFFNKEKIESVLPFDLLKRDKRYIEKYTSKIEILFCNVNEYNIIKKYVKDIPLVIVTNENKPVIAITSTNTISYNVMNNYNIKSTTGAGDSFIGGFLSKYIINQDIDESISQGIYNSSISIENIGPLLSIESCIDNTTKSKLLPNNIIVIGNSCAGKTTFIDYFKNYYNIYSDIDDLAPLLETFMIDDLLYQNKIEEFKKIKNKLKYVNKIWEEYNDNINSINHYTKPAKLGDGHDIIRPILWDYIIQMAVVNSETHNIIQFSRGKDELYESQFSQNAYFRSIESFINNLENNSNSIIVNLVSSLETRKNRNRIRFENGGHYVSDDTMDNVYSKDIFEYTKTGENFGYLLVDGRTIPVYTIVNDKTLSEIELNKFLEYNVNKVIEYYNDFKEEKHGIKKDSKRYLAK